MKLLQFNSAFAAVFLLFTSNNVLACDDELYRQFDFWLGDWQVTQADGTLAGHNSISQTFGDCVIHEQYTSVNGYQGASYNIYDKSTQQWHQSWVDNTGLLLQLNGGLVGNAMVMWGEGTDQTGQRVQHRIKWTPQENGTVIQLWEVSRNQGLNWQELFKGFYKRSPKANTEPASLPRQ